ncbi:receptor-like protein 9DC3 [Jatropha curcas]|uniref:receptor-like protein 9DC3 n=1 Tax=Jatropha curcas TaxID=180498 RepID=UPI0018954CD8|nr:receptor-like protein 9DC3 [Jatropha curcas]
MLYGNFHSNNSLSALHHLQKLDLSYNNFRGSIIPSQIGHLLSLTHLNLNYSNFDSQIPLEIGQVSNLVSLDLSLNFGLTLETTATFDKLIRNLTKLQELDLSYTDLSFVSPNSFSNLSTSLLSLRLSSSGLRGKFPDSLVQLSHLEVLDLAYNEGLNGSFPTSNWSLSLYHLSLSSFTLPFFNLSLASPNSFINLSSSLSSLTLSYSGLRGKFPNNIIQLPNLEVLDLSSNEGLTSSTFISNWSISLSYLSLSSTKIPVYLKNEFFKNLKLLQVLQLNSCNFIGSNLELFGNLSKLVVLELRGNNFTGQIPSSIGKLEKLYSLDLSYNNFSGPIPPSFGNLSQLSYLLMESNNINGPIPSFIGKCNQLRFLYLSYNNFSGPIPSDICRLSSLVYLSLSNNLLTGQVCQFKHNNTLELVDLSHNKLSGTVPSSIFNQVDLMVLILSLNEKLTGEIPSAVCENHSESSTLSSNNSVVPIPQCLGNFSSSLSVLHLDVNQLNGSSSSSILQEGSNARFEPSIGNFDQSETLDLSSNNLLEGIPNPNCNFDIPRRFRVSHNQLEDPYLQGPQFNTFEIARMKENTRLCGFSTAKGL